MLDTFLAVLGALICWTIITEGCIFLLQIFLIRWEKRARADFIAKNPDFLSQLIANTKHLPFHHGVGESKDKNGPSSGPYL